jgi:polyphosphate kinase
VLSIRQTLCRTNENSPIVRALMEAAQSKEVTVVVESKAASMKLPTSAGHVRWKMLASRYFMVLWV